MKTFRDQLAADLVAFFNVDEFGEIRNINGKDMPVVIDEDLSEGRPRQPSELYYNADGIYKKRVVLYVRSADFGPRPHMEDTIKIDDELYLVAGCSEQSGVLVITLEVYRS
jgi:hypothetical protein